MFSKFFKDANGAACSIWDIYSTFIDGENTNITPKWSGLNGASKSLTDIKNSLNNITWQEVDFKEFKSIKNDSLNEQELIDYKKLESGISIYEDQVLPNYPTLVDNKDNVISTITDAIKNINDFKESIDDVIKDVIDGVDDNEKYVNKHAKIVLFILFSLIVVISIYQLISIIFYAFSSSIICPKCLVVFLWQFLYLFTLVNFILGFVFGILGIIGSDGIGVVNQIISEENLYKEEPVVIDGDIKGYISTCMYGDGSLEGDLNLDSEELEKLNDLTKNIDELMQKMENIQNLNCDNHPEEGECDILIATRDKLKKSYENPKIFIEKLNSTLSEYTGEEGIYSMINCSK